ncbi:ABC transporter ATP-binding protein [Dehalococcoidia bacterium]|nr:ABC transporter ATP-binding protein [Dehalococcoidia bacterium]
MAPPVVETIKLTKDYNGTRAVDSLDLRIEEGEIFGFLGPNGAGKTTTILMLLGLTEPTLGLAKVCGHDATREPLKVKRITGYLPENVGFYEDLTARENLRYITRLNRIPNNLASPKIDEVLEIVGLSEVADREVGRFSRGMKQRLGMADVLVKDPRLVFLDEPTAGIDPDGASQILDFIVSMSKERGITVLLSSHLLHQVQKICDRVGIIVKGRMVAEGPVERLGREVVGGGQNALDVQVTESSANLIESIESIPGVKAVECSGDMLSIRSDKDVRAEVSRAIFENGSLPLHMRAQDYTLEEIYLKYFREE